MQTILQSRKGFSLTTWVGWSPPPYGWVHLNTDGCAKDKEKMAGGGGVLRDHDGHWLGGFSVRLGFCTAVEAEFMALIYGLSFAWDRGI